MGIDASMYALVKGDLSEADVVRYSYEIGSSVGPEAFFLMQPNENSEWARNGRRALERIEVYEQDGPDVPCPDGYSMLRVSLSGRYYGEGYERGDLWQYVSVAEWLERRLGAEVFYGGDSSGVLAERFDRGARERLIQHWAELGGRPYREAFDRAESDPLRQTCSLCSVPMTRNGWGPLYAAYFCIGCGHQIATCDGGRSWMTKQQEREEEYRIQCEALEMYRASKAVQ